MRVRTLARLLVLMLLVPPAMRANMVLTPWLPIFKGVERVVGTNFQDATNPRLQVMNCVRVDLADPDVRLFPTPRHTNYLADSRETMAMSVSNFVKSYGVQVAINANFFWSYCCNGSDPPNEWVPTAVFGLAVSEGEIVSVPDGVPPGDVNQRTASLMFTSNKEPLLVYQNPPPGTNTDGIFSAITGYFYVLSNSVNVGDATIIAYPDGSFHGAEPRTLIGVSQDRRYLFLMTIDGRQSGYSQGALSREAAEWLLLVGASDGIAMDGGGSTSMYMADCLGNPVGLNKSSYAVSRNRERIVGSHLGIIARPLDSFISDVAVEPGSQSAIVTWTTASNATSQVEYGLTPSYGNLTPLDATETTNHSVLVTGLTPQRRYYFRVLSVANGAQHVSTCAGESFVTTNFAGGLLMPITQNWRYSTNNLDGINWQAISFDDSGWSNGPAAMWADTRNPPVSNGIPNFLSGTRMPYNPAVGYPWPTYYLRTRFVYSNSLDGLALTFSNYLDDGAVFYLNGVEIQRINMPSGPISNNTYTPSGAPCGGNATCPIVFTLTNTSLQSMVIGTNLLAVEVHNFRSLSSQTPSPDIVFQSALIYSLPPPVIPPPFITNVVVIPGETTAAITWTTRSNATSQILYGTTGALGSSTDEDSNSVVNHAVVITGLRPLTEYFYHVVSRSGTNVYTHDGTFMTTTFQQPLVTLSNAWRYTTNNLDGVGWAEREYDDSAWLGEGPALLFIENNPDVFPRATALPPGDNGAPNPTFYFRTHFTLETNAGFALLFTNFIDDGAVFYLNGVEVQRVRMPSGVPPNYEMQAAACPPNGCDATFEAPDVFRLGGDVMTNLVVGDNVLAAEVHQFGVGSSDIVFGSDVALVRARASETRLRIAQEAEQICLSWDGEFLALQQRSAMGTNDWSDVAGAVQANPYCLTNPTGTVFFRLRD
jgi:hypothetical protein